jgi:hypothetical protein
MKLQSLFSMADCQVSISWLVSVCAAFNMELFQEFLTPEKPTETQILQGATKEN